LDQETRLAKSKAIAETLKATKTKRKTQVCKVREMKIIKNKLSKEQAEHLRLLFLEAKWFYNYMLANPSMRNDIGAKTKSVSVKLPDGTFEERELKHISAQMKQSIASGINQSIKTLAKLRDKGIQQPGALKFKSQLTTIELKQYGSTHRIDRELNKVFIQGLKKGLKVKGLEQLDELEATYGDIDIASAKIIDRPDGIFFKIVCYVIDNKEREQECVGIDMGLGKHISMSNNLAFRFRLDETKKLTSIQQKLSRKKGALKGEKKSNNFKKVRKELNKEHQKIVNKKTNAINHIVSLIDLYQFVACQDEQIAGWSKENRTERNKEIYHTGMGAIKSRLKSLESSRVDVLNKYLATTKTCSGCGNIQPMPEHVRVYHCKACGLEIDRDKNSTLDMIIMSKFSDKPVSTEYRNLMPRSRIYKKIENLKKVPYLEVYELKEAWQLIAE
jgi:transposase IS605 orfB